MHLSVQEWYSRYTLQKIKFNKLNLYLTNARRHFCLLLSSVITLTVLIGHWKCKIKTGWGNTSFCYVDLHQHYIKQGLFAGYFTVILFFVSLVTLWFMCLQIKMNVYSLYYYSVDEYKWHSINHRDTWEINLSVTQACFPKWIFLHNNKTHLSIQV